MKKFFLLILMFSFFMACEDDPTSSDDNDKPLTLDGVYITNEGNFGQSNGSLSYLNIDEGKVYNNIYKTVNGTGLGDVVQSMTIVDSLGYIIVNNSNKIEVISLNTLKRKDTIELPVGSSPRYMAVVDDERAYVTNLYTNNVAVINLNDNSISSYITVGNNPEQIVSISDKAYVANSGFGVGNTVSVINVADNQVIKTITVGDNPRFVQISAQDEVHILCSGSYGDWSDPDDDTDGGVYVIDPNSDTVVGSFVIDGHPSGLALNSHNSGYFLNKGYIAVYDTDEKKVLNEKLINGSYYSLAVDISNDLIFALDAKDYQQSGELSVYDSNGDLKYNYTVGIIPGFTAFKYQD